MATRAPTRRPTRVEQTETNRAAVLRAAREVFRSRGYTAATLDQIADEAGFSKGVVYSQFASKADLFLHVLDERISQRADENQAVVEGSTETDLDVIVHELHRLMSRSDPAWRLAVTEFRIAAARDPELLARYDASHRRTVDRLATVFDQVYARTKRLPPVPSADLAATILALDVGIVVEDASTRHPIPSESLETLIRRMVFGA